MKPSKDPVYTASQIGRKVADLAARLSEDYRGREVVALIVLKGSLHFGSDLLRNLTIPAAVDFIRAKSYDGDASTGRVEFLIPPSLPLAGKHVVIIEDILDTGLTARAILERVKAEDPASVSICSLFDKPGRREVDLKGQYIGFELGDQFVVGTFPLGSFRGEEHVLAHGHFFAVCLGSLVTK